VRATVKDVFAEQKSRMVPFVRTVDLAGVRLKIGMANRATVAQPAESTISCRGASAQHP